MAVTATLNKSVYAPGETMTLTVKTAAGERNRDIPISIAISVEGVGNGTATGTIDKPDAAITITDSGRTWTKGSDDGTTATFTATA